MVSAAIAAALFLLVLLLIEGWRLTPIGAAIVVTVMPLAAILGSRLGPLVPSARARAAAGAILVSGGLGGLALLPKAEVALTLPPQILVGIGLSLVLSALTETALGGRAPQAIHGGWTISARHAGVVIGLLALTPIFTADIAQQREDAINAGTAVILDSKVNPLLKIDLAQKIEDRLEGEKGKVPTLGPAFEPLPSDPATAPRSKSCASELQDQLDRGATHAFSPSFGLAALLGLLALIPIGLSRQGGAVNDESGCGADRCWSAAAIVAALALVGVYLAAGGSSYTPEKTQDPCKHRPWSNPEGLQEIAKQFSLSALDGAACQLGVTRETLARALATPEARERFSKRYGIDDAKLAQAIRAGLLRAIDDAEDAGALSPLIAGPLRATVEEIPLDQAIELVNDANSLLGSFRTFLGPAGDLLEELLP